MVSTRFVPGICVLLALAFVPTVIHSYAGLTLSDGRVTAAISPSLAGLSSEPTGRSAAWVRKNFDTDDWIERKYVRGTTEISLFAARSYDLKRLYHHPELAVARGIEFRPVETRRLKPRPEIPVNVLQSQQEQRQALAMYVLFYDRTFVENPVTVQIRAATELLFTGRRQMTLFFVQDPSVSGDTAIEALPATKLLFEAIDSFLAQKSDVSR